MHAKSILQRPKTPAEGLEPIPRWTLEADEDRLPAYAGEVHLGSEAEWQLLPLPTFHVFWEACPETPSGGRLFVRRPCFQLSSRGRRPSFPLVGVHLPGASMLGIPADHLPQDDALPLDALWGTSAKALEERLARCHPSLRLALLLRDLGRPGPAEDTVHRALCMLRRSAGTVRIERVAESLGVCVRGLQRRFRLALGCSPKQAARAFRIQAALGALLRGESGASIAAHLRFADQSHLIAECRGLLGQTPRALTSRYVRADALLEAGWVVSPHSPAPCASAAPHGKGP